MDFLNKQIERERQASNQIHPDPTQFSQVQIQTDPILHFFHYSHLPAALQSSSRPFCELAEFIIRTLPRNVERTVALRKLLEAKDAAVRSNVGVVAGAVASGGLVPGDPSSFFDRLKIEQKELGDKLGKLREFLKSGCPGVSKAGDIEMLNDQAHHMSEYHAILSARIENIEHASRNELEMRIGADPFEDQIAEVREIGDADIDRDGPIDFKG